MRDLTRYFEKTIDIARIRHGKRQSIETLTSQDSDRSVH